MKNRINTIIDRYKNSEVYIALKKYYVSSNITEVEYNHILNNIKNILVNFYLYKYKFKTYFGNTPYDNYLLILVRFTGLLKKIEFVDDAIKIYPISPSEEELFDAYRDSLYEMVDYQIEYDADMDSIFEIFTKKLEKSFKEYKQNLLEKDFKPYYGNVSYIIKRSRFVQECIRKIPGVECNIDTIINKMEEFEKKYLTGAYKTARFSNDFIDVGDEFKRDFDTLEEYYKMILDIENKLAPLVVEYWKRFLTNPLEHSESNYKYLLHTFSSGMVDPKMMKKACCAFNSDKLVITPYGSCGLIYDITPESLETLCTEDVGSWVCDKETFIERDFPTTWQLTKDSNNVWYEFEENSKLIMPEFFEREAFLANVSCNGEMLNNNRHLCYSEIYLNDNAKAIGVFYTDDCKNIDEVMKYAEQYNLPVIHISLAKQRELNGLPPLETSLKRV